MAKTFQKLASPKEKKRSREWGACKHQLTFGEFLKFFFVFGDLSLPHAEFWGSDSWFVNLKSVPTMGKKFIFGAGLELWKWRQTRRFHVGTKTTRTPV
jgi:hypothetical protein